jgi:hypothetical protein
MTDFTVLTPEQLAAHDASTSKRYQSAAQEAQATIAKQATRIAELMVAIRPFADLVKSTSGRIPTERLSLADWHFLVRTYDAIKKSQQ